jgi:flagella basal body P-ring formation protein FlgA
MPSRLFAFFICALLTLGASAAGAASFRPEATVDGDRVTLADLFDDAGDVGAQVVAQAPAPGRRMIFDARALASLAQAYGLDWRPASPHDRTVIQRSALILGGDRIGSMVQESLAAKGVARPFAIVFDRRANQVTLPVDAGEITVASMSFDPDQGRFSGTLEAATPNGAITVPVSGRVAAVVEIPVLNRPINAGEIIGVADLDLVQMQSDRVARDTLTRSENIIGRTVEHPLPPGRPLRLHDLKRDLVVKRGQTVTVVLDDPNISLITQGRALTDGAKGEPVKVLNTASSRVVEGFAAGPDLVTVSDNTQPQAGADRAMIQ